MSYLIEIAGLAEAVAACDVDTKHRALIKVLRGHAALREVFVATIRGDRALARRQVYTPDGQLVAEDHREWLKAELERDGGDARTAAERLRTMDYRLTYCEIESVYCVVDRGGSQDDFLQLEIDVLNERLERRAFFPSSYGGTFRMVDLRDLIDEAEQGVRYEGEDRRLVAPPRYRLRRVFDASLFLDEAEDVATADMRRRLDRAFNVTTNTPEGLTTRTMSVDEIDPGAKREVWRGRRLFNDWAHSSAGGAGRRLCRHWVLQITDYTSPAGVRSMDFIPMWTHTRKIARIDKPLPASELRAKLRTLDQRTDVPFAWFFYMVHGNLVEPWAGERILAGVDHGEIDLAARDLDILRRWQARSYQF
jgi:hypothetical protein